MLLNPKYAMSKRAQTGELNGSFSNYQTEKQHRINGNNTNHSFASMNAKSKRGS